MPPSITGLAGRRSSFISVPFAILVFVAVLIYIAVAVEPALIYHGLGIFYPYHHFDWDGFFIRKYGLLPGGPALLLTGWLSQWYYDNWLGAAAIAGVLFGIFCGMAILLQLEDVQRNIHIAFLPIAISLFMCSRFDHILPVLIPILIAVWIALAYAALPGRTRRASIGYAVILIIVGYILAGGAVIISLLLIVIHRLLVRRGITDTLILAIISGGLIFVIGTGLFAFEAREVLFRGTYLDPNILPWLDATARWSCWWLYILIIVSPIIPLAWRWCTSLLGHIPRLRRPLPGWVWHIGSMALVIAMYGMAVSNLQVGTRYQLQINKAGMEGDWDKVLQIARQIRLRYPLTPASVFEINRALAHLGLIGDELFCYPQAPQILALFSIEGVGQGLEFAKRLHMHMDIGDLNAAEQDAYELLEVQGPVPFVLKAMAFIHLSKGQYEAARVVFNNLARIPSTKPLGQTWLKRLQDPNSLQSEPVVASLRRYARIRDTEVREQLFDQIILDLLKDHPDNRLALEYLIGYYLLTRQDAKIVGLLPMLRQAGYTALGRHCHEAVLVYASRTGQKVEVQGFFLDMSTLDRFNRFNAASRIIRQDRTSAASILAKEFADTYMYYYIFGTSGLR